MRFSPRSSTSSNAKDECHIERSSCASIWMMSTSMSSKKNSSMFTQSSMTKEEVSFGPATRQADRQLSLNLLCHHHSPLCRHSQPLRLNLSLLHLLPMRNDGNSRSCSVISWTPPDCHLT